ncbi:hypothetical protein F5148DRAFT_981825 [Russula earlei]|uniref:Uncharacterized protein n=1 Tax=Russula earlei TaxID=71964 RepID=A0ACC0U6U6_9AGAM|nr:hypothetical protein F5148DRAFT_981825 [Russula earlei]
MDYHAPTTDEMEEILLSCRYGDVDDVTSFIHRFGTGPLSEARDENGNTVLHMASANGHVELLVDVLLPIVPQSLLSAQNRAGSTALHWAALNSQLATARALVDCPRGPGIDLIDIKNSAGRSPLGEAEAAGWDDGAKWMIEVMRLDNVGQADGDAPSGGDLANVEYEAPDTDGQVTRMSPAATEKTEDTEGPPSSGFSS